MDINACIESAIGKEKLTKDQALWAKIFEHHQLPLLDEVTSIKLGKELLEDALYAKTQRDAVMTLLKESDVVIDVVKGVAFDKILIILANQDVDTEAMLEECEIADTIKTLIKERKVFSKDIYIQHTDTQDWEVVCNSFYNLEADEKDIETSVSLSSKELEGFLYEAYSCYLLKEL